MCALNRGSLEVLFTDLAEMQSLLGIWLIDAPRELLVIFDEALHDIVLDFFPHYSKVLYFLLLHIILIYTPYVHL